MCLAGVQGLGMWVLGLTLTPDRAWPLRAACCVSAASEAGDVPHIVSQLHSLVSSRGRWHAHAHAGHVQVSAGAVARGLTGALALRPACLVSAAPEAGMLAMYESWAVLVLGGLQV